MPCYRPITAYQARFSTADGKRPVLFQRPAFPYDIIDLACGQCIGCRLERSRVWAMRCVHEAQLWSNNCFITLTYDDEHLPAHCSLVKSHFQKFMKRLRRKFPESKIRYYMCGEYGDESNRPHYHAILFNFDFLDKVFYKKTDVGETLYVSDTLNERWGKGLCVIGDVTFESAAYVARYVMKKVTGDALEKIDEDTGLRPYERFDSYSGEIYSVLPEYTAMSRRPGIGRDWFDRFKTDIYPHDFVVVRGNRCKPARYYDGLFEVEDPQEFARIKEERARKARDNPDNHWRRLNDREIVKEAQVSNLKRSL